MSLRLDWCSHEAAKYAVMKWHYSKKMPSGKIVKIGVWENEEYVGVILFGNGSNRHIGNEFNLSQTKVSELVRVALNGVSQETSKIVSIAVKMLRKKDCGLKLLVSYADPKQLHVGTIYQAMNWVYTGVSQSSFSVLLNGRWEHPRTVNASRGTIKGLQVRQDPKKHRYLMPLDKETRAQIEPLRKPYPKKTNASVVQEKNTSLIQAGSGGSIPTPTLQT